MADIRPRCFVLMPFRDGLTNVYADAIRPAAESEGFICERADEIMRPGVVLEQIDGRIEQASVIIADLTDRNPNVMQELGFARRSGKQIVIITQESPSLMPFDIRHYRVLGYQQSDEGLAALRATLSRTLAEIRRSGFSSGGDVLTQLPQEIISILKGANSNLARFRPMNYGNPEEAEAFRDKDVKGEPAYNRSFVWTAIPVSTLQQIMGQIQLLGLKPDETEMLHDLRLKVLNFNSLAAAKVTLLPNLVQGEVPSRLPSLKWNRWEEMEVDQLNLKLNNGCHQIGNACKKIIEWLSKKGEEQRKTAVERGVL